MKTKPVPSFVPPAPCEEDIRNYAYHLYEQSGRMLGHDLDNWLEATACLTARIPEHCTHRRLHRHVNEPQAGKVDAASSEPNPQQPPNLAGSPAKRTQRRH
jgi:hypothetical protein